MIHHTIGNLQKKKKGLLLHKYMNLFYLVYEVQNDQV